VFGSLTPKIRRELSPQLSLEKWMEWSLSTSIFRFPNLTYSGDHREFSSCKRNSGKFNYYHNPTKSSVHFFSPFFAL
jgi:hypothetical protein